MSFTLPWRHSWCQIQQGRGVSSVPKKQQLLNSAKKRSLERENMSSREQEVSGHETIYKAGVMVGYFQQLLK